VFCKETDRNRQEQYKGRRSQTGAEKQLEDITLGSLEAKTMSNMVTNWFERTGSKSLSTKESKIPKCSSTVHPAAQQFKGMLQHLETRTTEVKSAMTMI
jgi:NAD-specific glutamate dehydrogenase